MAEQDGVPIEEQYYWGGEFVRKLKDGVWIEKLVVFQD
jgi:hypothetical protein